MEALKIENFSFVYAGASENSLSDVSLAVEEGAFCLVVGPSGSGKTTLLRCIKREISPSGRCAGSIEMFGSPIDGLPSTPDCGFVFQSPGDQIVCDVVWHELAFGLENMGMEPEEMRRRVAEVATFFGIGEWLDRRCASLSGGQKQVLNIASVIAMRPSILLLDEPVSQLDPISAQRVVDMLSRVNREFGITVVVATHSPEVFLRDATCAFRMDEGIVKPCPTLDFDFSKTVGSPVYSEKPATCSQAISVDDIFFSYERGADFVLNGLSLEINKGEVMAIVGANACGKSTLLKVISCAVKPTRGHVENRLVHSQGYLPQDPRILFLRDTVKEELEDWQRLAGYSDSEVADIAASFGLDGRFSASPLDLSGGGQQKLALAKLLLCHPDLLLLDEPGKGLDARSQLEIGSTFRSLASQGCTIVFATHDLAFSSRVADRIALVFDGQVACCQNAQEFCEGNMFYVPRSNGFTNAWDARWRI